MDISTRFPHALWMKITVRKEGGMWHGYVEGRPEVDERGLTEEVARRKAERIAERLTADTRFASSQGRESSDAQGSTLGAKKPLEA